MKYQISLASLEKIANPFKQISVDYLDFPLSIQEIEEKIHIGYVKKHKKLSQREQLIKEIVTKIANMNIEENIIINLDNPINKESGWIVENVSLLAALIYIYGDKLNDININADIIGEQKKVENLFGAKVVDQHINLPKEDNKVFDWFVYDQSAISPWADKEIVLKETNCEKIIELADECLWQDKDFLIKLFNKFDYFSKNMIQESMPDNIVYNDTMLELASEDPKVFINLWTRIINTKSLSDIDKTRIKNQLVQNLQQEDQIRKIFSSTEKRNIQSMLLEIPMDLRVKNTIVDLIYMHNKKSDNYIDFTDILYDYFPSSYFTVQENTNNFILNVIENSRNDTIPKNVFDYWVQDKEHMIEFFDKNIIGLVGSQNLKGLRYLYKCMPPDLQEDKDLIISFIKVGYTHIASQLNKDVLADKDIIMALVMQGNSASMQHNLNVLNIKNVFSIEDSTYQKTLLKHSPQLIHNKYLPPSWLEKPENILACLNHISIKNWEGFPKSVRETLTTNKEWALELIKNDSLYEPLSLPLKLDADIAIKLINNIMVHGNVVENNKKIEKIIPQSIWLKKDFCVQALFIKSLDATQKIPEHFFNEKDFIIKLLSKEGVVKDYDFKEAMDRLPERMNIFFKENNIEKNYLQFMEKVFFKEKLDSALPLKTENKPKKKI